MKVLGSDETLHIVIEGVLKRESMLMLMTVTTNGRHPHKKTIFVNSVADAITIGEIINCAGISTIKGIHGRRVRITIEEIL